MSESMYTRTEMMLGCEAIERLKSARVAVFGIGGVGGFTVEALCRAGVGSIAVIDSDRVSVSNLNRQIIATDDTVGMLKTDAAEARIHSINPECRVTKYPIFYSAETADSVDLTDFDYIADCIDSVSAKLHLIKEAKAKNVPIISSMGAGNKLDPTRFRVADIYKTSTDPLARAVRTELKRAGINCLKVVFSDEPPINQGNGRTPGSISFVPSVVGLIIGGEIIKDLTKYPTI